jgi:hypothetical protein
MQTLELQTIPASQSTSSLQLVVQIQALLTTIESWLHSQVKVTLSQLNKPVQSLSTEHVGGKVGVGIDGGVLIGSPESTQSWSEQTVAGLKI